jgi:hypothetical protein
MRRRLIYATAFLALGTLALAAPAAEAQTTAVGPYYATPSWDQTMACTAPASCSRFVVLSNFNGEAVLDRETGLVWERTPGPALSSWNAARFDCSMSTVWGGGFPLFMSSQVSSIRPSHFCPPAIHSSMCRQRNTGR